jgi:hypothetical protein
MIYKKHYIYNLFNNLFIINNIKNINKLLLKNKENSIKKINNNVISYKLDIRLFFSKIFFLQLEELSPLNGNIIIYINSYENLKKNKILLTSIIHYLF